MADSGRGRRRRPDQRRSSQRRQEQRRPARQRPLRRRKGAGETGAVPRRSAARRRSAAGGILLRLFAMLLVVAGILAGAVLFFKVTDIQVIGCQLYTQEQVIGASGIAVGDGLLLVGRTEAAARLKVMLPYIETVRVGRYLPGTIVIEVTESEAAFSVEASDGTSWLIDASGKLLERTEPGAADYPKLSGVIAKSPEAGQQIVTDQQDNLAVAEQLLGLLEETDLVSLITEIDVTQTFDIIIWYGQQYEIHLGGSDQLDYKLRYLLSILDQLDSARGGVIDLTLEEKDVAIFREFEDSIEEDAPEAPSVEEPGPEEGER